MLALYCLYSGGVSGWVGGVETLYWRVETTAMGRERERQWEERKEEEMQTERRTKEGNKQRKTEKRKKREKNEKQLTEQPSK